MTDSQERLVLWCVATVASFSYAKSHEDSLLTLCWFSLLGGLAAIRTFALAIQEVARLLKTAEET